MIELSKDEIPNQLSGYEIIERFHADELKDKPIFDFIPIIVGMKQIKILDSWANFFRNKAVPFIIARKPANCQWRSDEQSYSLWKERYC